LPVLTDGGGNLSVVANPEFTNITLPSLARVGSNLTICQLPIVTIAMPALVSVGADVMIDGSTSLEALSLPALADVGGTLSRPPSGALEHHVALAREHRVASRHFETTSITTISLPALTTVGLNLRFFSSAALTDVAMPAW
jgi:hypothetical protein